MFASRAAETGVLVGVHQGNVTHAKHYVSACDKPRLRPHLDAKCLQRLARCGALEVCL